MSTNDITIISSAYHNISKYYAIINNVWIPTSRYSVVFKWLFYGKNLYSMNLKVLLWKVHTVNISAWNYCSFWYYLPFFNDNIVWSSQKSNEWCCIVAVSKLNMYGDTVWSTELWELYLWLYLKEYEKQMVIVDLNN